VPPSRLPVRPCGVKKAVYFRLERLAVVHVVGGGFQHGVGVDSSLALNSFSNVAASNSSDSIEVDGGSSGLASVSAPSAVTDLAIGGSAGSAG
jgi:hypothetical protein